MTVQPFKGGRSVKAPYEQTHLRIPLPIKDSIEKLVNTYRFAVRMGEQSIVDKFITELKIAASNYKSVSASETLDNTSVSQEEYERTLSKVMRLEAIIAIKDRFSCVTLKQQSDVLSLLQESLKLKPNAGGAIKKEIRKAIAILQS